MNEVLEMTRGDTLRLKFQRMTENKEVIKEQVDEMFMTCKKRYSSQDYVFQKCLSKGSITYDGNTGYYHIKIEPEDTENLRYREYVFDIEITQDNNIKTVLKGTLNITEEATWSINKKEVQND